MVARAADAGVRIYPLGDYCVARNAEAPAAILLGYGNLQPSSIEEGVRILAGVVAECTPRR